MTVPYFLLLATLLPLASFLVLIFFGRKFGQISAFVATAAILGSFAISVYALVLFTGKDAGQGHHQTPAVEAVTYNWINLSDTAHFQVGLMVDSLTLTMFVMITAVATLVHVFSIGYMKGDSRFSRFFAYLGLFCFSMLGLVVSNSLLQLFIFWELVGVCSYLLIGFWFEKRGPALASKKAMVTNRIGDAGFLVGLGILLLQLGPSALTLVSNDPQNLGLVDRVRQVMGVAPVEYLRLTSGGTFGFTWLTWAGICLFIGAMAKSAQFPLHVWLPDAMEGPTPVSALIHAATMVAAGVYLVARIFPILTLDARLFVAIIGCTTLLMAALIALVMTDIKKILAYSTISQLGFMILFLGCGGYVAGLFHLMTHAFFKACLFLGSGAVIAACHHEQEVTRMGGLWRKIPVTALTFGISVLAIAGTPFFSGWFSKDLGLAGVYEFAYALPAPTETLWGVPMFWAPRLLFWIPTVTAYLTAFYMWRCWWLTFGGKPRVAEIYEHAKEHPVMTLPLIVLGVLAIFGGVLGIRELIIKSAPQDVLAILPEEGGHGYHAVERYVTWAFLVGPVLAIALYCRGLGVADRIRRLPVVSVLHLWLKNKMFFDHLYEGVIVNVCKLVAGLAALVDRLGVDGVVNFSATLTREVARVSGVVDRVVVDGAVNGVATAAQEMGRGVRAPDTGRVRFYVMGLVTVVGVGVVGTVMWMLR